MISTEGIRATGMYLLEVLKAEKSVPFSRFYNDAPGIEEELVRGATPFVTDTESCSAAELREEDLTMLEFAAWQLEDLGIVRIDYRSDRLMIDGEPNFTIRLTEKGDRTLATGLRFHFRRPGYSIVATGASEWLIIFLAGGGPGQTLTLSEVMEYRDSDGDVTIPDDCGNEYRLGTASYAWAFEVSLWHHAKAGNVIPACRDEEQGALWSAFVTATDRPPRPDINSSNPIWDVPFRLAEGLDVARVRHVAEVS